MIINNFIFHTGIAVPANGNVFENYNSGFNTNITISIGGSATTRSIHFEAKGDTGDWIPMICYNVSTNAIANNTTGIADEIWTTDITGIKSVRCRVASLAGGSLSIVGKVVG